MLRKQHTVYPRPILCELFFELLKQALYHGWKPEQISDVDDEGKWFERYAPDCDVSGAEASNLKGYLGKVSADSSLSQEKRSPAFLAALKTLLEISGKGEFTIRAK